MTVSQIKAIFTELGLSVFNKWVRFPSIVSEIQFANDARDYVDNTVFYKIDTTKETIYASRNHTKNEEIDNSKEYTINGAYPMQYIDGFVCSSVEGPYGSYYTRSF